MFEYGGNYIVACLLPVLDLATAAVMKYFPIKVHLVSCHLVNRNQVATVAG